MTRTAAPPLIPPKHRQVVELLAHHWPRADSHQRQQGHRALAGGLLRGGLPAETAEALIGALAAATDDEEAGKRVQVVHDTAKKLNAGAPVEGWPSLVRLLGSDGEALVGRIQGLLDMPGKRIVAVYDYVDEAGCLRFQTVRYNPKGFSQRRPDGKGGWHWNLAGAPRLLYRLPELLTADANATVFIPEGEKDVDNLRAAGLVATTNPMGAGKWRREFNEALRNRKVVILPDNDVPGREHAQEVARTLNGVAASVKVLELPNLPAGGDISHWLAAGNSTAELQRMADALEPPAELGDVWGDLKPECAAGKGTPPPEEPLPIPDDASWPAPLAEEAFYGLAGEVVRVLEPTSEADPAALLFQLLVAFGSVAGRGPHFSVEADRHHTNEYVVLIGRTSKARKGTSWGRILHLLTPADEAWAGDRVQGGLSSGEGLIWAVRDPIVKRERIREKGEVRYEDVVADEGIDDKRLLVHEPEFANVLKQTERQGNILSAVIRPAWDSGCLRTLTKNNPARATGAHISIIGHITCEELRRYLSATESANGFGNRFLWVCVDRSKALPEGGNPDPQALANVQQRLAAAVAFARGAGETYRDDEARELWRGVYAELSEGQPGLTGALLGRAEAHVMRLAMIYALLDCSATIGAPHLMAALALWQYVEESVRHVFGDSLGDPVADELLLLLRGAPQGLTRTEIRDFYGRNQSAERLGRALGLLVKHKLARLEQEKTSGRPAERWYTARP
jgi:5S rRNA maturation endonuclease (ribonuclease M5)